MAATCCKCPALLVLCLLAGFLTGCGRLQAPSAPPEARLVGAPARVLPEVLVQGGVCGAEAALPLVGGHFTALADLALPGELRVLWPGQQVTDEVAPLRMNAQVSEAGTIRRVFCG